MRIIVCLLIFAAKITVALDDVNDLPSFDTVSYIDRSSVQKVGNVKFTGCQLRDASAAIYQDMACAVVTVPENYQRPDETKIPLFVAKYSSNAKSPKQDPLLLIAGGPGQAASESFLLPSLGFNKVLKHRDIYLIDQRGTGKSNALQCPEQNHEKAFGEYSEEEKAKLIKQCLSNLSADPRFYTTSIAIKDFEQVRIKLAIKQWNLYGVSYGTRVAQHYMRRYPESIRVAILDGVVAPQHLLGTNIAQQSQRALTLFNSRCRGNVECNKRFPDFLINVEKLFTSLTKQPVDLKVENIQSGALENVSFSQRHLASFVRLSLYSTEMLALMPVMLHAAYHDNNYLPLARAVLGMSDSMLGQISQGMHNAVVCSEDLAFMDNPSFSEAADSAKNTYLGNAFLNELRQLCNIWPKGFVDADFKAPLKTDIPTLLLSGSVDPVTPPEYAEQAARGLTNKKHIIVEGFGHGVARVGCLSTVMAQFVDGATTNIDSSCITKQKPSPVFVDFNGPMP